MCLTAIELGSFALFEGVILDFAYVIVVLIEEI